MKENKNNPEQLTAEFEQFLRRYLRAGDSVAIKEYILKILMGKSNPTSNTPIEMVDSISDQQVQKVFEKIGPDYGIFTSIPDEKIILSHLLPTVKDVRTLTVGSGVGPHEIFLASKGIITKQIVATDYTLSLITRGRKVAKQIGVTNVRFARLNASELPFRQEFEQVWSIDSLHWIIGWKIAINKACEALKENGSMFICYSRFSPRIRIDENDLVSQLTQQGMDVMKVAFQESPSRSARAIVTATKTEKRSSGLIIPSI